MGSNNIPLVSVIVNYFNPKDNPRISATLNLALESLAAYTEYPLELIIVDGSGRKSPELALKSQERGWIYLECTAKGSTSFARTYNQGMEAATGDYRVWMASDIFVNVNWEKNLIAELERTKAWMAAPLLTSSDYLAQTQNLVMQMSTFKPSAMTFNLNIITKECYEKVGLMDERFSGCFNDLDYLLRIREAGGEAIIVDAGQIIHIGRATRNSPSVGSTVNHRQDHQLFLEKYPKLKDSNPYWDFNYVAPILCKSWAYRQLIRACYSLPIKAIKSELVYLAMRLEPLFHRC